MLGANLVDREGNDTEQLRKWYSGPTLLDLLGRILYHAKCQSLKPVLDRLEPPTRDITSPFRFPISNVFKGQGSGTGITGRVCGGVVQVGERVRVLPGDETGIVKCRFQFDF
jgi:elongation factor 1 alpha-like protein